MKKTTVNAPTVNAIVDALTTPNTNWGVTQGQPLTISFSFISALPNYYQNISSPTGDIKDFLKWVNVGNPNDFTAFTQNQEQATSQTMSA